MRQRVVFIIRVLATFGLFFILYRLVPYKKLFAVFGQVIPGYVLAGFLLIFLGNVIGALRWRFLLHHLGIELSRKEAVYSFFSATFFNIFFPSVIAGDAFRSVALISRYRNPHKVIFSVLMDRVSGFIAVSLLVLTAFFWGKSFFSEKEVVAGVAIIVVLASGLLGIIFNGRVLSFLEKMCCRAPALQEKIVSFYQQFPLLRKNPFVFVSLVFGYSMPIQVLTCLSFVCLARAFSLPTGAGMFFVLVPLAMVVAFLPLTVAGIGTRELATVYFFAKAGIASEVSLGMSLFNLMFMMIVCIIGGIIYVSVYHRWLERRPSGT